MISKSKLQIILQNLKESTLPKPDLEQYSVSGNLAAEILNLAYLSGDIKNKTVFDLGCGTGRLAIGAWLLGARKVVGIDIDKSVIEIARENVNDIRISFVPMGTIQFVCKDIEKFSGKCDTVVQNPPFGVQSLHADRVFLEKALDCGKKIYSLHKDGYEKTREFLTKFIENKSGKVEQIIPYKFSIPHMFRFHKKPRKEYNVDLYVIKIVKYKLALNEAHTSFQSC